MEKIKKENMENEYQFVLTWNDLPATFKEWREENVSERKERVFAFFRSHTGGAPKSSFAPFRRYTFTVDGRVELDDLRRLSSVVEGRFGIHCFQYVLRGSRASMLFDFFDESSYGSVRLNSSDLKKLKALVVLQLGLPRPTSPASMDRYYLLMDYALNGDVFRRAQRNLYNRCLTTKDYSVLSLCLSYAEKVCQGRLK